VARRQLALFPAAPPAPRVTRMRVIDAGHGSGSEQLVHYRCWRCGHDAGWWTYDTVSAAKRGAPCPDCNRGTGTVANA